MTDKIPLDAALRSRVADLLHLLQFARIETPTAGDAEQAEKAVNDLERMLAAPAAAAEPEPVAWMLCDESPSVTVSGAVLEDWRYQGGVIRPLYIAPPATEQPDTVAVPRKLLAEAESIIESYAEALRASHAPGGDWDGEEAAQDGYEREAGVASKLRRLLAGGAE